MAHLHINQRFDDELANLKSQVLSMGGLVERQIGDALRAFVEGDSALAEDILRREKQINRFEVDVDEAAASIIAKRQPAASDLRLVLVINKIVRDLERTGDEAKKIAKLAVKISEEGASPFGSAELRAIGAKVESMLNRALNAFVRVDVEAALDVVRDDKEVDREYKACMHDIVLYMTTHPDLIPRVIHVLWALRSLERIGDHARNIAEYVFYLNNGKDLRHAGLEVIESSVRRQSEE